jgi:sugar/nucleoside kinase (ribokinase family)
MKIKQLESPSDTFDLHFPEGKPFDVVGYGTNSVDYLCIVPEYPPLGSKTEILHYEQLAGGQVATTIAFLSRMGLRTKYIGKVGEDELGRFSLSSFDSELVDTASVLVERGVSSQVAFIIVDGKSGERTVLSQRGIELDFRYPELAQDQVCSGRMLHLDGYDAAGSLRAATWCREKGIPVSIDLDRVVQDCSELINKVDFLIVSSNFPVEFSGISDPVKAFQELRNHCDGFLAVTLGAAGAMAWVGGRCLTFPGLQIKAVDTTGAGDVFHGAFIYGLLQNWSLERIMKFGNAAAGLSCRRIGARAGIRPLSEILQHTSSL